MSSPFLYNLSLTLIHFIWQGIFVALALKLALTFTSYKKPQWRYAMASLAMVANLLLPFFTFYIISQADFQQFGPLLNNSMLLDDIINNDAQNTAVWYSNTVEFLPYLSLTWVTISFALAVKLFIELYNVNQLPKIGTSPANAELEARFQQLVQQVKLTCSPRLLISLKNDVPMAIGWLKPIVLVPVTMLTGLTPAQLDMLILHELAHIRRHDYLVNFIQTLVEIFLFFHPAVRWVSKQMRNEREYCSDDIAVQHCGNPVAYAHTLADTASICDSHRHHSIPAMAMAASGGDLKQRVLRLIDHDQHCSTATHSGKWLASIVIIFSIIAVGSKKYIQIPSLDIGTDTIPLYRSTDDGFKTYSDSDDTIALPSLAQQLLHQSNENTALENKLPAKMLSPFLPDNTDKNAVNVEQEITQGYLASGGVAKSTGLRINHQEKNTVETLATAINNKIVVLKKTTTEPVNNFAKSLVSKTNQADLSNTQVNVEKSLAQLALSQAITMGKSPAELAFERTDSTKSASLLKNPYAAQIANLTNDPLSINSHLAMPTARRSKSIEQVFSSTSKSTINLMPARAPAQLLTSTYPKYPSNAKRKGIETDVEVTFTIDKNGYVRDIQYDGEGRVSYFRNTIRSSLEKWRFTPASYNDQPVESTMSKIFSFSIAKE
ncbi:M56 family metallopeptidase [Colwellia hornerae]|uniref:TonB family protein n=1 Tax=Colwellia hornerae TaxID=89402 RepID=A0A5C6QGY9_9GAMM|nr:M56 family metallopeptidase [Colwellia hornerae]TWX52460.1 TonB family protein [Colwellia hornerae]TWX58289.1 TonB family protein [Colwellia hornerae]TWX68366.1 TonB family protein [Colwellia hornerae]